MKRHGFHGVGASHGSHRNHRKPGSIGGASTPGRVFKGMRMAGRMGGDRTTTQNLTVHAVDADKGLLLIKGAIPGPKGGVVLVRTAAKGTCREGSRPVSTATDRRDHRADRHRARGPRPPTARPPAPSTLPADIFDVQVNVPLIHQVVVAQLAAARQGTPPPRPAARSAAVAASRTARRAPAAPARARPARRSSPAVASSTARSPASYAQRTPKKMKAAALRGALSDRARNGRIHVVAGLLDGDVPSTKTAIAVLAGLSERKHVLVVVQRSDELTWKSLRNAERVHLLAPTSSTPTTCWSPTTWSSPGAPSTSSWPARPTGRSAKASATESEDDAK